MTLEDALVAAAREAAAAWPTVRVPEPDFVAYLRARVGDSEVPEEAITSLHAADLYLVFACLRGDAAAWRELDRTQLSRVGDYVSRIDGSRAFADEVRQLLSEKLLPDGSALPRLARYSGRGPLGAWMRVAAVRVARDAKRGTKPTEEMDDTPLTDGRDDAEVAYLRRQFAAEFEAAFTAVLAALSTDERNVLKLHYLDGLTIEQVGKVYSVSRATAARWIASARDTIVMRVRDALAGRIAPSTAGPASVLALIQSQLGMSLRRHMK